MSKRKRAPPVDTWTAELRWVWEWGRDLYVFGIPSRITQIHLVKVQRRRLHVTYREIDLLDAGWLYTGRVTLHFFPSRGEYLTALCPARLPLPFLSGLRDRRTADAVVQRSTELLPELWQLVAAYLRPARDPFAAPPGWH